MIYETSKLQLITMDKILSDSGIEMKELTTKDDLNKTGVIPLIHIQYVGALHTENLKFKARFNIYIVHKTLSLFEKQTILEVLDKLRLSLMVMRLEYEKYVSKQHPLVIVSETITETKGSLFVYMFTVEIPVRIYKK